MFQLVLMYYAVCSILSLSTFITMCLSIFTPDWDVSSIINSMAMSNKNDNNLTVVEIADQQLLLVYENGRLFSENIWVDNPSVIASTRVGLWHTCLNIPTEQYENILLTLPWLGPLCVSHEVRSLSDTRRTPQWFKVMNISISCCLTSLIILSVAMLLTVVGMWHKQVTCLIVDSVLFMLAVFFFLLHVAIHWTHSQQRVPALSLPPLTRVDDLTREYYSNHVTFSQGWSQHIG